MRITSILLITGILFGLILVPFSMMAILAGLDYIPTDSVFNKTNSHEICGITVTAYCPGSCCNGKWAGLTASGKNMEYFLNQHKNIIAVDPDVIPLGSKIFYNNIEFVAVDTGAKIKGHKVDILFPDHAITVEFGIKKNQKILVALPDNNAYSFK